MANPYDSIRSLVPKRSRHLLKDYRVFDFDIGNLVPIEYRDCVPGDNIKIGLNAVVRMKPLVSPTLGQLELYAYYFFVPYRILDPNFEDGITGGEEGDVEYTFPTLAGRYLHKSYNLANYFGLPSFTESEMTDHFDDDTGISAYPIAAYHSIWNNYFRVEDFQPKMNLSMSNVMRGYSSDSGSPSFVDIHNVSWARDYFTSCLKKQQKGVAPAFPLGGWLPLSLSKEEGTIDWSINGLYQTGLNIGSAVTDGQHGGLIMSNGSNPAYIDGHEGYAFGHPYGVDMRNASTFDVAELRTVVQIQKILERANRTGSRYTEYLRSFFTVSPKDSRLQRPEFIGGSHLPIIINEVVQTSSTTGAASSGQTNTPQGTMTGHGITLANNYIGKYFVEEYGCVIGVMFARPKTLYSQGINRQWLKKSRYDFYLPQLCNLSEQGVLNKEIYYDISNANNENDKIFGFQGRWNEMRSGTSFVNGNMRDIYAYWHFGRHFDSRPNLNSSFLECNPNETKKIYAVQSEPGLICECCTVIDAVRPITQYPEPGKLDHDM